MALLTSRAWIAVESSTPGHVYWCPVCGHALLANEDGLFLHDAHTLHPVGMRFDEEDAPQ